MSFGHGWPGGLSSAGFTTAHVPALAEATMRATNPGAKIMFYTSSAAAPGRFGDAASPSPPVIIDSTPRTVSAGEAAFAAGT